MGQPGQTYIDRINEGISGIQDTFRLTDEEIGRFVRHRGSKVKIGGWDIHFIGKAQQKSIIIMDGQKKQFLDKYLVIEEVLIFFYLIWFVKVNVVCK